MLLKYLEDVFKLDFESSPNYSLLREDLLSALSSINYSLDMKFDWSVLYKDTVPILKLAENY